MWLNLLVLLMLLLITLFQSMQGLFGALILLVLAVISSVVAFGFYEDLYNAALAGWLPEAGEAVSLMAIFLVCLLALRVVVDFGIKGDVLIPEKVNKAGAALLGLVAGMIMTGTAVTAVQMLPFGQRVLGFARTKQVNGQLSRSGVWFGVDRLAVGLSGVILDGSLSGKAARTGYFGEVHPDLLGQMDARRATGAAGAGTLRNCTVGIEGTWSSDVIADAEGKASVVPGSGMKFLGLTAKPSGSAGQGSFAPAQVRLVGWQNERIAQFPLKAAGAGKESPRLVQPLDSYMVASEMSLVFEVPTTVKPWYLQFKHGCRGEIVETKEGEAKPAPTFAAGVTAAPQASAAEAPAATPKPQIRQQQGRTGAGNVLEARFTDRLPMSIPRSELAGSVEAVGNKYKSGQIPIDLSKVRAVPSAFGGVNQFDVPSDKRMLQVVLEPVRAGSLLGQAINFADYTMMQGWIVADSNGQVYHPVGIYAIAKSSGSEWLEIQYSPENLIAGHTIGGWQRLKDNELKSPDARLTLLYHVPAGTKIVEFRTGRNTADLSDLSLVAPD